MTEEDWQRPDAHSVAVFLNGDAIAEPDPDGRRVVDDSFLLLLNSYWEPVEFRLPDVTYGERWTTLIDTAEPQGPPDESEHKANGTVVVERRSLVLLSRPSAAMSRGTRGTRGRGGGGAKR
jgi:glycogen operon protein